MGLSNAHSAEGGHQALELRQRFLEEFRLWRGLKMMAANYDVVVIPAKEGLVSRCVK